MAAARAKILPKIRKDYNRMLAKHLKNNYVVATLAAKYGISERTVYNYVSKTKFQ
jgi:predicted AAA+ superfamily ATPase